MKGSTRPYPLTEAMATIPFSRELCDTAGIEFKDLLKLEFSVSISRGKLILEAYLPGREQASSVPNLGRSESNG